MAKKKLKTTEEVNHDVLTEETINEVENTDIQQNKPTTEDINRFREEFENMTETFKSTTFNIVKSDILSIKDIANYLLDYNTNKVTWSKDLWQGIIKFNEFIKDQINKIENNEQEDIQFSYMPLEYIYFVLSNPIGIGLKSAEEFEQNIETFAHIYEQIENNVVFARNMLKDQEIAQQRWAAAEQGFFLEVEDENDSQDMTTEEIESSNDGIMIPTAEGEIGFIEDNN